MQTPGTYISAVGHVGLIGWLLLGWGFYSDPLPFEVAEVSVVTGEEFDRMMAARTPDPGDADPTAPAQPVVDDAPPPQPALDEPAGTSPPPEPAQQPAEEAPPPQPPAPLVTDASDAPPVEPAPPPAPPPTPELDVSPTPAPPQADRVAATPSAPPPPDAQIDDITREEVVPDETADPEVIADETQSTAPEETATQIAIADVPPTTAIETSMRPQTRPSRPTPPAPPAQEQASQTEPDPAVAQDDINDLLADLGAGETPTPTAPAVPLGQQLSDTEVGNVQSAIGRKWQVDTGSESASIVVTVAFSLSRDGVIDGDVRLIGATDGSSGAVDAAFQRARRALWAVSRSGGFPFPSDKYEQWKDIEAQFDPSGVRLR